MPLHHYGVLVAGAVDRVREGATDTPHYQIHLRALGDQDFRIAVNVLSQEQPSELLYLVNDDFRHPVTALVGSLDPGWHDLASRPGTGALDFIRGNLFDAAAMRPLAPDVQGPDNDLADIFDHYVQRAIDDPDALVYAFGERWGPERDTADKVFHFLPGDGVHDIHMNQGNSERFLRDDGVWQDGGLLFHFPAEDRWVAVFLAFQSQSWHTDDRTGHAIDGPEPKAKAPIRVLAAMVNPTGPAPEDETVLLINASPEQVDLTGWVLVDQAKARCPLPPGALGAGESRVVHLDGQARLGNKGGQISVLDAGGLKVHGVAYTAQDAADEGWTVTF